MAQKKDPMTRLKMIRGQLNSIELAIEQGKTPEQVMQQVTIAAGGLQSLALLLLEQQIRECLSIGDVERAASETRRAITTLVRLRV